MTPFSIAILSLSMSADACAAAIGRGACLKPTPAQALRGGLIFGAVEAITPIVGWSLGVAAAGMVEAVDHWIAFLLLCAVGAKMAWEGATRARDQADCGEVQRRGLIALLATAVATSIDAAAVGVTLAILGVNILIIALSIGFTTFVMTTGGMLAGRVIGSRFGSIVELIGGVALIALGTKILIEHTMLG